MPAGSIAVDEANDLMETDAALCLHYTRC